MRFMRGMHSFAQLSAKAVLSAFDLSPFRQFVDLGGATGKPWRRICSLHSCIAFICASLGIMTEQMEAQQFVR